MGIDYIDWTSVYRYEIGLLGDSIDGPTMYEYQFSATLLLLLRIMFTHTPSNKFRS